MGIPEVRSTDYNSWVFFASPSCFGRAPGIVISIRKVGSFVGLNS